VYTTNSHHTFDNVKRLHNLALWRSKQRCRLLAHMLRVLILGQPAICLAHQPFLSRQPSRMRRTKYAERLTQLKMHQIQRFPGKRAVECPSPIRQICLADLHASRSFLASPAACATPGMHNG
jgi:hypothetical protein